MWTLLGSRKRRAIEDVAPGIGRAWPAWARTAVESARLAPSGGNKQPWAFRLDKGGLALSLRPDATYETKEIDCGIAMLHAELGAQHEGTDGRWERLSRPDVARFTPEGNS